MYDLHVIGTRRECEEKGIVTQLKPLDLSMDIWEMFSKLSEDDRGRVEFLCGFNPGYGEYLVLLGSLKGFILLSSLYQKHYRDPSKPDSNCSGYSIRWYTAVANQDLRSITPNVILSQFIIEKVAANSNLRGLFAEYALGHPGIAYALPRVVLELGLTTPEQVMALVRWSPTDHNYIFLVHALWKRLSDRIGLG
jgi:hypothetical protein